MGMFCRFGSTLLNLPVAVIVCLNVVCIFPVSSLIISLSPSMYVPFSLVSCLYSNSFSPMGWVICSNTSALVEYPVFVFFPFGKSIFSNKIDPSCLGELILNSSPANSYMSLVSLFNFFSRFSPIISSTFFSTLTPVNSISAKIAIRGISMFIYSSYKLLSFNCSCILRNSSSRIAAFSMALKTASLPSANALFKYSNANSSIP